MCANTKSHAQAFLNRVLNKPCCQDVAISNMRLRDKGRQMFSLRTQKAFCSLCYARIRTGVILKILPTLASIKGESIRTLRHSASNIEASRTLALSLVV